MSEYLCPTCEHAAPDWCNVRYEITEAQTECSLFKGSRQAEQRYQRRIIEEQVIGEEFATKIIAGFELF